MNEEYEEVWLTSSHARGPLRCFSTSARPTSAEVARALSWFVRTATPWLVCAVALCTVAWIVVSCVSFALKSSRSADESADFRLVIRDGDAGAGGVIVAAIVTSRR